MYLPVRHLFICLGENYINFTYLFYIFYLYVIFTFCTTANMHGTFVERLRDVNTFNGITVVRFH